MSNGALGSFVDSQACRIGENKTKLTEDTALVEDNKIAELKAHIRRQTAGGSSLRRPETKEQDKETLLHDLEQLEHQQTRRSRNSKRIGEGKQKKSVGRA